MTGDRLRRLRSLLGEVLALPEAARSAFVAQIMAADAALGSELAELRRVAERDDPELEPPVLAASPVARMSAGQRLGAWRLERCIGRGGMGEVWLATRADGAFTQRVAIKVPRAARPGPGALARFEGERALLAELEDPGVARLVDGGWQEGSGPWLAMEFVEGDAIDRHAEAHQLDVRGRVRLLIAACRALAAAHRRRIVHRDLKPGNVLVRADGRVVLVDFGIAAALDHTAAAGLGHVATPAYCAPEQLQGASATTAADVYSLAKLGRELVGTADPDLAAVFDEATHADPAQRTPSIDMFAADLQRWTEFRPVEARRPSMWRRLGLWRRRTPAAAAAVLTLGTLTVTMCFVAVASWRAEHAERLRAAAASEQRDRRFAQVRALVRELVFGVHDRIATLPGAVKARVFVVEQAERHLDTLAADAVDEPGIAEELVEAHLRLAEVRGARTYGSLGDHEGAMRSAREAVAVASAWLQRQPTSADWTLLAARGHKLLGDLCRVVGRNDEACTAYAAARSRLDEPGGSTSAGERKRLEAVIRLQVARIAVDEGRLAAGLAELLTIRARFDELAEADLDDQDAARNAALALNEQGLVLSQLGREEEAAAAFTAALDRYDVLCAARPHDTQLTRDRIETELELALTLARTDGPGSAARLRDALAAAHVLLAQDPANFLGERLVHRGLLHEARIAALQHDLERASSLYHRTEPLLRSAMQRAGNDHAVRRDLAESLIGGAEADRRRGAHVDAAKALATGLELLDADAAFAANDHRTGNLLTMAWIGLGHLALAEGDAHSAQRRFEEARAPAAVWAEAHSSLAWPLTHLALIEHGLGTACESLGNRADLALEQRCQFLQEAQQAFERGLTIATQLASAGRLHGADKAMPRFFEMDVARVTEQRQRLSSMAR